ncbi:hypothetical protein EA187_06915 [Lujinxingia sediminis]|uniref:Uncharacterized protein n=1 Tax=Lujinxingia sediminis TaxID=2480984 RepID=A0ABY0CVC4_9DELT|nr:hypothetical protein [Lujinxingia sediminis]RVU46858.1 hypothetical protein EA187_06915 [Lujinxingia sediminis]
MRKRAQRKRLVGVACMLLAGVTGCQVERGDSDFEAQVFEDAGLPEVGPSADVGPGDGSGAGTLGGIWLQAHRASSCVLGQEQVSMGYYIVTIAEDGELLDEQRALCELELSPVLGLRPVVPPAVIESIATPHIDQGFVTRPTTGGAYTSATEVGLWGLELDDPTGDSIPAEADNPAVVDADNDGQPGVTLEIAGSGCRRYMAQRQIVRYTGQLTAPNRIEGGSATTTRMEVYGASASLCAIAPDVEPNDAYSAFTMVRIDGLGGAINLDENADGTISCAEAAPTFSEVLANREPDNENCRR